MIDGILIAAPAALVAMFFSARAYNAHRERRLARMEQAFTTFADMAQLLLRGQYLQERQIVLINTMLSAFAGETYGWITVQGLRQARTRRDPVTAADVRAMPDVVLDALALAIDCYYQYVSDAEPIPGFFIRRIRQTLHEQSYEDNKQNEARIISDFQASFDRRHLTAA